MKAILPGHSNCLFTGKPLFLLWEDLNKFSFCKLHCNANQVMFNKRVALNPDKTLPASLLPGPSQRLALVLKCRWFVFFKVTLLGIYP